MRAVICPIEEAGTVFKECVRTKRSSSDSTRLLSVVGEIEEAERQYKERAAAARLYETAEGKDVSHSVTGEEMRKLYSQSFARKTSPVRGRFYDSLMLLPAHAECPMCGHRRVGELDHYLPQKLYPLLTVTPLNLVACCKECNHAKREYRPSDRGEQLLHPYFDQIPSKQWLSAEVLQTKPPVVLYRVLSSSEIDPDISVRLKFQFEKLELGKLYTSNAGRELSGRAMEFEAAWKRDGAPEVRVLLNDSAESWASDNKNCWQAALFRALADSDWFCSTGYSLIRC